MEIGPIDNNKPQPEREAARQKDRPERVTNEPNNPDKSEISDDARHLAEEAVQERNNAKRAEYLQQEKMRLIRKRVEDGYYSRRDILEKMADRILEEEITNNVEPGLDTEEQEESAEPKAPGGWDETNDEEDRQSESTGGILGL